MVANRLKLNAEKTKLLRVGRGSVLRLRPSVKSAQKLSLSKCHDRVLEVTFSSDLSVDNHVASVCSS